MFKDTEWAHRGVSIETDRCDNPDHEKFGLWYSSTIINGELVEVYDRKKKVTEEQMTKIIDASLEKNITGERG